MFINCEIITVKLFMDVNFVHKVIFSQFIYSQLCRYRWRLLTVTMNTGVQMLASLTLVTAFSNFEPAINNEVSFSLALSLIVDFYEKQSNTIFVSQYSVSRLDTQHAMILGNIFAVNDPKISVAWTINDRNLLNHSVEKINNIIIVDSYESWR